MAKTLSPCETSFQAPVAEVALDLVGAVRGEVDQRVLDLEAGEPVRLEHDHVGSPFLAEIAVWNLLYSSLPWPALVQQTWTSVCALLKLSTTFGHVRVPGPHRDLRRVVLHLVGAVGQLRSVASSSVGAPLAPPPLLLALVAQADSRRPMAKAATPVKRIVLFIFDPFVLPGRRCSESE